MVVFSMGRPFLHWFLDVFCLRHDAIQNFNLALEDCEIVCVMQDPFL
jgi:hypothetical protein